MTVQNINHKQITLRQTLHKPPVIRQRLLKGDHDHVDCVVFLFCLSSSYVLYTQCCHCLWIVHSWLPPRFSIMFIFLQLNRMLKHVFYSNNWKYWCP